MTRSDTAAWNELDAVTSRGSSAGRAGSLGALHEHRDTTLSQFFTPSWLVDTIWTILKPAMLAGQRYRLLDNSMGAASMFRQADPQCHELVGIDIDAEVVTQAQTVLERAGFAVEMKAVALQDAVLPRASVALINPPFSIPLTSPHLQPVPGVTHYGRLGPDTSALSHEYAVVQALSVAGVVAAVVPRVFAERLDEGDLATLGRRLWARYALPANTFREEGVATVAVDLLIFGPTPPARKVRSALYPASQAAPLSGLVCRSVDSLGPRWVGSQTLDPSQPAIRADRTGNTRVDLRQRGRWIKLAFHDGATEARVLNALYQKTLHSDRHHRYPAGTRYAGQFRLSLDVLILQDDPERCLDLLAEDIATAGGQPVIATQLRKGLKRLMREHAHMSVPYGRACYRSGPATQQVTASRMGMLNPREGDSAIAKGQSAEAQRRDNDYLVTTDKGQFSCTLHQFDRLFGASPAIKGENQGQSRSAPQGCDTAQAIKGGNQGQWVEVSPPISASYPDEIAALRRRAISLGLDRWLAPFQLTDLCELAFRPRGGVCGWEMGLGKTRLILALTELLPGNTLIVLKSRLIDEFRREVDKLGLDASHYTTLGNDQLLPTTRVSLISYERLRRPLHPRLAHYPTSRVLKGRFENVICDEGSVMSHRHTQQTRALWQVGGRRRFAFDGTPMANYAREMLPLVSWAVGEAVSHQPFSANGPHLYPALINSALHQRTGRQAFHDLFVTLDWATNEFLDTGKGAKREIPKIPSRSLGEFRDWIAPVIKRRVQQEPEVASVFSFPVPDMTAPEVIEWDDAHLACYIETAEEFADWYRRYAADCAEKRQALNLTLILARLEACFKAANAPHTLEGYSSGYHDMTSKQRRCVALAAEEVAAGNRPIVFARNPAILHRLAEALEAQGITTLVFTGERTIKQRNADLEQHIRSGNVQVMLASLGVTQDGLNLPELNTAIFYNRSYEVRQERQALFRLIRPTQQRAVTCRYLHLAGSIDEYMAQVVDWKALASESGLDYGEGREDAADFSHFDAFLYRFIESVPALTALLGRHTKAA